MKATKGDAMIIQRGDIDECRMMLRALGFECDRNGWRDNAGRKAGILWQSGEYVAIIF